ncbi:queuine trna-ribosyltransferase subunit qtrtd1-like [Plasmopara halstedii]|uniref:Queuine tRNA-ribosyltransferase accessory subunit 2 n=1 Tax=Plasmopara halstedii TaxID=4781 RepID=A0A0P1B5H9_PLAHL|nr:queuine trna-ribosyltransferase subunit qtrtd1-like [Plasmopara halstedii]CEG49692.1 queuine trna-ribosyltransferase subunit qtrtd1-like [Plasmopara halstedii]|eukprot:XP_024586061.1 queuine trna-ribosyltransferase subunit qtrtd1-like [Plasmopara halstedii]
MLQPPPNTKLSRVNRLFCNIRTPCYIPPSIVGNVPHLTPDNCSKVNDLTSQVIDFADIAKLVKLATDSEKSLRSLLRVTDYELMFSAQNYIGESYTPSSNATGFMMETSGGRRTVSIDEYMKATDLLQPELVVPFADEIPLTKSHNRQRAAVQTSLEWLDACQKLNTSRTPMCGVIVGGDDELLRRVSAVETCKRDIQAILISGLGTCANKARRLELIEIIVREITPASLPRIVTGIGHPLDVMDAVSHGIDAFVSPYPAFATKAGYGFIFWISAADDGGNMNARNEERELSGGELHLRQKRFASDFKPLLVGCDCFACQKYTRAYIHHLLDVREMLGEILLYFHNLHHYYRFFREIRSTIDLNNFAAYHAEFVANFEKEPNFLTAEKATIN